MIDCNLCGETVDENPVEHFRRVHGMEFERWPDGELVWIDDTLEPEGFGGTEEDAR